MKGHSFVNRTHDGNRLRCRLVFLRTMSLLALRVVMFELPVTRRNASHVDRADPDIFREPEAGDDGLASSSNAHRTVACETVMSAVHERKVLRAKEVVHGLLPFPPPGTRPTRSSFPCFFRRGSNPVLTHGKHSLRGIHSTQREVSGSCHYALCIQSVLVRDATK